jgi:hypothetical protein
MDCSPVTSLHQTAISNHRASSIEQRRKKSPEGQKNSFPMESELIALDQLLADKSYVQG